MVDMEEKVNIYHAPYHWTLPYFYNYQYERPIAILEDEGLLGKDKTVLDVGCGDGRISFLLSKKVGKVYGIDNQPGPVEMGKLLNAAAPNVELSMGDACEIPFPEENFDLVVSMDVVEHVPEDMAEKMVSEMARVCKKGGHVVVATPNRENLRSRLWGHKPDEKHYKEYTVDEMCRMLENAGLTVRKKYGIYLPPPVPMSEHYANVMPFKFLFKTLVDAGKSRPSLSEKMLIIAEKQ